jgi:hypothetical protein
MTKSWSEHKAAIIQLYLVEDIPLSRVKEVMEETHGFHAS